MNPVEREIDDELKVLEQSPCSEAVYHLYITVGGDQEDREVDDVQMYRDGKYIFAVRSEVLDWFLADFNDQVFACDLDGNR